MTCKHCGAELVDNALFCSECGARQEPVIEEPIAEPIILAEPAVEEPVAEESITEEPAPEEPVAEEPITEESAPEEPVAEEPITEEPAPEEPVAEEPIAEEPTPEEPVAEPIIVEPVFVEPAAPTPTFCPYCGNTLRPGSQFCGRCGRSLAAAAQPAPVQPIAVPVAAPQSAPEESGKTAKQKKEKADKPKRALKAKHVPPLGVRILLRFLSFLLCLVLCVSILATAVVLDLRQLTKKDNMDQLLTSMLSGSVETPNSLLVGAVGGQSSGSGDSLDTILDWTYDYLKDYFGDEMTVTQEQMKEFVERSTAKEALTDKLSSYVDDFLNGTQNTEITADEIIEIIDENEKLIEEVFGEYEVNVDIEKVKEDVEEFVAENDLNAMIREEVFEVIETTPILGDDMTVKDLLEQFRFVTSDTALVILICINVLIIVLLFFTNWMRLYATLNWAGTSLVIVGGLLALPTLLLQLMPNIIGDLFSASLGTAQADMISSLVGLIVKLIAPVHYILLLVGLAMLICSIVIKIVKKVAAE